MKVIKSSWLLLSLFGLFIHQLQGIVVGGSCPPLLVPTFGQLVFNNTDVTQSQPVVYNVNDTVEYRCAQGYGLKYLVSGAEVPGLGQFNTTQCMADGNWSLPDVTCQLLSTQPPVTSTPGLELLVPAREALIIVGAVLGAVVLLLLLLVICCWCWTLRIRSQLSGEETFGQSHQGAFVMSNPLMMIRDDEPSGDPLYLTPSEMTEFDRLGTLNTPTKQQKTKHK